MRRRTLYATLLPLALAAGALGLALAASGGPHDPFERYSPEVDAAVAALNAGRPDEANERLTRYLRLQGCEGGVLQTPPEATSPSDAAFDLGLGLFGVAERFGVRFDDVADAPPVPEGQPPEPAPPERKSSVDCARMLLGALLERRLPPELEARARFLRGNAAFLERRWDEALADYERALRLAPGSDAEKADPLGRDLAWNRALALRNREREREREREKQKERDEQNQGGGGGQGGQGGQGGAPNQDRNGQGGSPNNDPDQNKNDPNGDPGQGGAGGSGGSGGAGSAGGGDQGQNDQNGQSGQGGAPQSQAPTSQGAGGQGQGDPNQPPGAPRNAGNQDEHMLDQFEQAPTWQREEGKARGAGRKLRGAADK